MELFIKTIFWIATLHSFLHAYPTSPATPASPISPTSPSHPVCKSLQAREMLKDVNCSDSDFYTPENVEDKCITTALDCIRRELSGTAQWECIDENEYISQAVGALDEIIKKQTKNQVNRTECPCERWPTTSFKKLLHTMEHLCHVIASRGS